MQGIHNFMDIINARVPGYSGLQKISLDTEDRITQISLMNPAENSTQKTFDLDGNWLSLGGIDLQINGALGLPFPDLDSSCELKLKQICNYLWEQGVDGFVPTIVTTSVEKIQRSLATLADFMQSQNSGNDRQAQILGVHLEGPFLNPQKRGAHPAEYLLPLTLERVKEVLGDYGTIVKIMTLAPELDITDSIIPYLKNLGITVSLGHSLATAQQAEKAFAQGASMVTHSFNAMPSLHHREPGLLGAAMINPQVKCGLIADGQHVCKTMMKILLKASDYDQGIFLVSDALSPLGLPDGIYGWDEREIEVKQGTAKLPDGTLAGTTLSLLSGVENLVKWNICEPEIAIALATNSPRKALNISDNLIGEKISDLLQWKLTKISDLNTNHLMWERGIENRE